MGVHLPYKGSDIKQLDDVLNIVIFKDDSETGWEFQSNFIP